MLTFASLVYLLLYLLVFCLVLGLIWWAGNAVITLLPAPVQQVAKVILIVLIALICIGALLNVINGGFAGGLLPRLAPLR